MRHLHKLGGKKKYHTWGLETARTRLQFLEGLGKWKLKSSKVTTFSVTERHCIPEAESNTQNKKEYFVLERTGEERRERVSLALRTGRCEMIHGSIEWFLH